jgi:hypothetical protein
MLGRCNLTAFMCERTHINLWKTVVCTIIAWTQHLCVSLNHLYRKTMVFTINYNCLQAISGACVYLGGSRPWTPTWRHLFSWRLHTERYESIVEQVLDANVAPPVFLKAAHRKVWEHYYSHITDRYESIIATQRKVQEYSYTQKGTRAAIHRNVRKYYSHTQKGTRAATHRKVQGYSYSHITFQGRPLLCG